MADLLFGLTQSASGISILLVLAFAFTGILQSSSMLGVEEGSSSVFSVHRLDLQSILVESPSLQKQCFDERKNCADHWSEHWTRLSRCSRRSQTRFVHFEKNFNPYFSPFRTCLGRLAIEEYDELRSARLEK